MLRGLRPPPSRRTSLRDLAAVFLRLGLTSFGGPAGHVALMRDEFVRRRRWLDDVEFVDLVGISNILPGPTSTELALHLGHRRAGAAGLVVAGVAFIAPAVVLVLVLAWIYVSYGTQPEVSAVLAGIAPVVVAIVAHSGFALGHTAWRSLATVIVGLLAVVGSIVGVSEILLLLALGVAMLIFRESQRLSRPTPAVWVGIGTALRDGGSLAAVAASATVLAIFAAFLKIGAILFGSGYVLVALLRSELVVDRGWITDAQLLDAVAAGQITPGPLLSTATFIGYLVGGMPGAVAATVGIFLPAFIAVALSIRVLDRLKASVRVRAFLDGVSAAAVGLLVVVAARLAVDAVRGPLDLVVGIAAFVLLAWGRIGSGWLVLAGAVVGLVRGVVGSA